ncbi:tRNA lysidine(34) synthetase TilS [Candidatus Acetothermia bacterium]|nr:tRNA lysidine(34) synthetase TilS [Candidatus Acetothermia bacterium]MBI3644143.1 tRNA lysidine(34) synthetase TilS [Candidatus Acetothermia bacterium]
MLEKKIEQTIKKYKMLAPGDRVLIAVSGGVDSVVLFRTLCELAKDWDFKLAVAHLDHQMRMDSHKDAEFVSKLAKELGVPVFVKAVDVPQLIKKMKRSPEEVAREARYAFLKEAARKFKANPIALGHHLNDRVETFLLNLLRGSGLQGLAGMPPVRSQAALRFIRPLIDCTRDEIEELAHSGKWKYRNDPSNQKSIYTRNRVRQELLPVIMGFNPNALETIARASETLHKANRFVDQIASEFLEKVLLSQNKNEIALDREMLRSHDEFLLESVLREAIRRVKGNVHGIESAHIERALHELDKKSSGSWIPLGSGLFIAFESSRIVITTSEPSTKRTKSFCFELSLGGNLVSSAIGWHFEVEVLAGRRTRVADCWEALFDFDKIKHPLVVRNRRRGDRVRTLGLKGEKKIQDILVDAKIPRGNRDLIPIICDSDGILWVVGLRMSERARVTAKTRKIMRIRAIPREQE